MTCMTCVDMHGYAWMMAETSCMPVSQWQLECHPVAMTKFLRKPHMFHHAWPCMENIRWQSCAGIVAARVYITDANCASWPLERFSNSNSYQQLDKAVLWDGIDRLLRYLHANTYPLKVRIVISQGTSKSRERTPILRRTASQFSGWSCMLLEMSKSHTHICKAQLIWVHDRGHLEWDRQPCSDMGILATSWHSLIEEKKVTPPTSYLIMLFYKSSLASAPYGYHVHPLYGWHLGFKMATVRYTFSKYSCMSSLTCMIKIY